MAQIWEGEEHTDVKLVDFRSTDFKYKPEGADDTNPAGASGSTAGNSSQRLTSDLKMTLDEACLILNVKKDTPLEAVQKVNHLNIFC
jgi:import inner membrane translocase subunit TIM16